MEGIFIPGRNRPPGNTEPIEVKTMSPVGDGTTLHLGGGTVSRRTPKAGALSVPFTGSSPPKVMNGSGARSVSDGNGGDRATGGGSGGGTKRKSEASPERARQAEPVYRSRATQAWFNGASHTITPMVPTAVRHSNGSGGQPRASWSERARSGGWSVRSVYVRPWFLSNAVPRPPSSAGLRGGPPGSDAARASDTIIGLEIDDSELVRLIRTTILSVYRSIPAEATRLPLNEQDVARALHLELVGTSRSSLRMVTVARTARQMRDYAPVHAARSILVARNRAAFRFVWHPTVLALSRPPASSYWWSSPKVEAQIMPFTLPVSLMKTHVGALHRGDRFPLCTFKSDGQRMSWTTMTIDDQRLSVWTNRIGTCWAVAQASWPAAFYQGTMWDGELERLDTGEVAFLVFDVMVGKGRVCGHLPLLSRLQIARLHVEEWEKHAPSDRVKPSRPPLNRLLYTAEHWITAHLVVRVKRVYALWDLPFLVDRAMPTADCDMDGWILMTDEDPVESRRASWVFKFKNDHTPDLQLKLEREEPEGAWYSLWTYDGRARRSVQWSRHGHTRVTVSDLLSLLPVVTDGRGATRAARFSDLDGKIVEVRVLQRPRGLPRFAPSTTAATLAARETGRTQDPPDLMYRLCKVRSSEKTRPNNLETVEATEKSRVEQLGMRDVVPASYLLGVLRLRDAEACSHTLNRLTLPLDADSLPCAAPDAGVPFGHDVTLAVAAGIPAGAGSDTAAADASVATPPGWTVLALRDQLSVHCTTKAQFNAVWRVRLESTASLTLPPPTPLGPVSSAELYKQHRTLCAAWSAEHNVYTMMHT